MFLSTDMLKSDIQEQHKSFFFFLKKLLLGACTARSIHQLILRKIFNFLLRITVIMFSVHAGIFRITVASYWLRKYRCKLQL